MSKLDLIAAFVVLSAAAFQLWPAVVIVAVAQSAATIIAASLTDR